MVKTFADELSATLISLATERLQSKVCTFSRFGIPLKELVQILGASSHLVRSACEDLKTSGAIALFSRSGERGRPLYAWPLTAMPTRKRVCVSCGVLFLVPMLKPHKPGRAALPSPRQTCSTPCRTALAWTDPDKAEKRRQNISKAKTGSEGIKAVIHANTVRWSKPGEREKFAERTRERWRDPALRISLIAKIKINHNQPEFRERMSEARAADWKDPVKRERLLKGNGMRAFWASSEGQEIKRATAARRNAERRAENGARKIAEALQREQLEAAQASEAGQPDAVVRDPAHPDR